MVTKWPYPNNTQDNVNWSRSQRYAISQCVQQTRHHRGSNQNMRQRIQGRLEYLQSVVTFTLLPCLSTIFHWPGASKSFWVGLIRLIHVWRHVTQVCFVERLHKMPAEINHPLWNVTVYIPREEDSAAISIALGTYLGFMGCFNHTFRMISRLQCSSTTYLFLFTRYIGNHCM